MSRNGKAGTHASTSAGAAAAKKVIRCAVYTRKSTEEGLEKEFNSLDAQRESGEAFVASMKHEGWVLLPERYDDGGYTGGNVERPALKRLMAAIDRGEVDCLVVYKVDRLSRSLLDFARMMEVFDRRGVSFVSVTQQFNTTHSMGRLTLNILLSFAQFEREIISERTRDKIAAARRKGKWSGGRPVLGYDLLPGGSRLEVNTKEAQRVRAIFEMYLKRRSVVALMRDLDARGWGTKSWTTKGGKPIGGRAFNKNALLGLLTNVVYLGQVRHHENVYEGEHEAIVDPGVFERAGAMIRENGATGGMYVRNRHGALLKSLLVCVPCQKAMVHSFTSRGTKRYRYYVCTTCQTRGWDQCPSKSIPAGQIEDFVVERIRDMGRDPAVLAATLAAAEAHAERGSAALEGEAKTLRRDLGSLHGQITKAGTGGGSDAAPRVADLHDRARAAEERLGAVEAELAELAAARVTPAEARSALAEFAPLWEGLSPRERARVVRLLVERVEYDGAKGSVAVTFRPSGIRELASSAAPAQEATA